jgi:hypothetical protein
MNDGDFRMRRHGEISNDDFKNLAKASTKEKVSKKRPGSLGDPGPRSRGGVESIRVT